MAPEAVVDPEAVVPAVVGAEVEVSPPEVVVIPLGFPVVGVACFLPLVEYGPPAVVAGIRPHGVLVEELVVVCRVTWLTIQSILRTYLTSHLPEQCRV